MRPLAALLVGLALCAAAPPSLHAAEGEDAAAAALARFRRAFRAEAPERRAEAFRHLDPALPAHLPGHLDGLRDGHWLVRGAAAEGLARVPEGPLRFQLRLHLLSHEETPVRSGVAYAFSLTPLAGDGEALAAALEDRNVAVRRDAARALRALPSRGAVDALVTALARETDARARVWILDTLRSVARRDPGGDPQAWSAWWRTARESAAFRPPEDVPPETREYAGVPLEVVTLPSRPTSTETGGRRRPVLLVLAPFGWSHRWYGPHLDLLNETFDVTTVRLPSLKELTGLSGYGQGVGTYPVGRLARALDALREARGAERVVLLAEGATCWVAEAYALLAPRRTAGLLLLDGWLDAPAYTAALRRWSASRDPDEAWMAASLLGEVAGARDRDEDARMARIGLTHRLMDRADLLGHHLWTRARDPQGFATVPPMELHRRTRVATPALFVFPAASPLSGHPDAARIREVFPDSIVAPLDDTLGLPFVDRHDEFHRVVRGFVERFHLDR